MTKKFYSVEEEMFDGHNNYESEYFTTLEEAKKYAMGLKPISGGTHIVTEYEIEDDEEMEDMIGYVDGYVILDTKPVQALKNMSEDEFAKHLLWLKVSVDYGFMMYDLVYWFNLNGTKYRIDFSDEEIDEYLEYKGRSTENVDYKQLLDSEEYELLEYLFKEHKDEIIKEIAKYGDK